MRNNIRIAATLTIAFFSTATALSVSLPSAALAQSEQSAGQAGLTFIVNAQNPIESIDAGELADFFFKRKRQWPDGTSIRFIDHKEGSEPRQLFLREALRKTPRDVDLHWIGQKLYTGNSAPIQVSSDAMVISLVASFKGAIGYVMTPVVEGKGVKKIEVTGLGSP